LDGAHGVLGIGFLASGCSGWLLTRSLSERPISVVGALSFIYPSRYGDVAGFVCLVLVLVMQKIRKRENPFRIRERSMMSMSKYPEIADKLMSLQEAGRPLCH